MSGNTVSARAQTHQDRLGSVQYQQLVDQQTWSSNECARYLGIATKTWTAYVARHLAPPATGWDPTTGLRIWTTSDIIAWDETRPARVGRPPLGVARGSA